MNYSIVWSKAKRKGSIRLMNEGMLHYVRYQSIGQSPHLLHSRSLLTRESGNTFQAQRSLTRTEN